MGTDRTPLDQWVEEPGGHGLFDEIGGLVLPSDNTTSEKLLVKESVGQRVLPTDMSCPPVGQDRVGVRSTPPVHRGPSTGRVQQKQ